MGTINRPGKIAFTLLALYASIAFFAILSCFEYTGRVLGPALIIGTQLLLVIWLGMKRISDEQAVFTGGNNGVEMEEELRNSGEILSLAVELAHLAPWKYHVGSGLFEFSDEFYAIYGTNTAREGVFMPPEVYAREFVPPDDHWVVAAELEKALSTSERYFTNQFEHRIIRRDGEVRTIAVRINIVRDKTGKIVKWYGANQDITEYKRAVEALNKKSAEIRKLAYTDMLTGLPNRANVNELLCRELEKARRGESAGGVLFIDLDDLKWVNDTLGHTYGDMIIIEAGKRILEAVGTEAFVGRVGGDEFLVILPEVSERVRLARVANEIIDGFAQGIETFGERFHLTASTGIVVYPDDGDTVEEIFKNADNAMYVAKNAGKNCWRFFDAYMQAMAYEKMVMTKSLRQAVEKGELVLHYQPQVNIADGSIVGFEALVRWNSPKHGPVSPVQFIPLAEQRGIIHIIGDWVLREACRFARKLSDEGWENIYVAVNVSPYQLCADSFLGNVRSALQESGIAPCCLELEITENALMSSLKDTTSKLAELQIMGVRLALDDFGTGYSSLTYLQRLPVKTLKIDKAFIDMILTEGSNKAIIKTIVEMAHIMKMNVVAEGVETKEQLAFLAQCCCDYAQGFLYCRPVPEKDAVTLLSGKIVDNGDYGECVPLNICPMTKPL